MAEYTCTVCTDIASVQTTYVQQLLWADSYRRVVILNMSWETNNQYLQQNLNRNIFWFAEFSTYMYMSMYI